MSEQDVERDGVACKAPEVGGEELKHCRHNLAQHVHVESNSGQTADHHHERVATKKTGVDFIKPKCQNLYFKTPKY